MELTKKNTTKLAAPAQVKKKEAAALTFPLLRSQTRSVHRLSKVIFHMALISYGQNEQGFF